MDVKPIKPILKWVGGKTQILDTLITNFPTKVNNYHEVFVGGGSVLLAFLTQVKHGSISMSGNVYAYDLNEPLIYVYKNIQIKPNRLYNELQKMISEFSECNDDSTDVLDRKPTYSTARDCKENYYYWIRSKYNQLSPKQKTKTIGSAMFIFLNKTFRGVFRIGPNGFNVPYGHYKSPEIINKEHLDEVHELIQGVVFKCCDFTESLNDTKEGDFIYLDPPYAPETRNSFVQYTKDGFNKQQHETLFNTVHILAKSNRHVLMSNADVELVRDAFKNDEYSITSILCKRSINSKNPESKTNEVLVRNYDLNI